MFRRILETLLGFALLAGLVLGITLLHPGSVSRVTLVEATRSTKVVCVPAAPGATVYVERAEGVAPLGLTPTNVSAPVRTTQDVPVVAEGSEGPLGGAYNTSGSVASFTPCMRPISQGVLALPATADTELRVVNPDASEAAVDLTLYGADGEIQSLGARGIALAPYEERTIALSVLTSKATPVGVTVSASRGRASVVAFTTTEQHSAAAIPSTLATSHLLPGIPAGATQAVAVLANPSGERINASLTAYGATPAYTPDGGTDISIAPYSSVAVPLETSLAGEASAVSVAADAPVIAGLSFTLADEAEMAPVQAGTVLEAFTVPGGTVQLTNTGTESVTATVTASGANGIDETFTVEVGAGQTATQALPTEAPEGQRVMVNAAAPLFGAVTMAGDSGTWVAPLQVPGAGAPEPIPAQLDPTLQ